MGEVATSQGLPSNPAVWNLENISDLLRARSTRLDGQPRANKSIRAQTYCLSGFLIHQENATLDRALRTGDIRLPPDTRSEVRWPTMDQVIALRVAARSNPTDVVVVALAFEVMLRKSEISRLKVTDLRGDHIHVAAPGAKRQKDREVWMSPMTRRTLDRYIEGPRTALVGDSQCPYLLVWRRGRAVAGYAPKTIEHRVRKTGRRADPPFDVSPHDLRRSGARAVYMASRTENTLSRLQAALGHDSIDQTRDYIGISLIDQVEAFEARDRYFAEMYPEEFGQ
jgi:integrase